MSSLTWILFNQQLGELFINIMQIYIFDSHESFTFVLK